MGIVYLIQPAECKGINRYKIGCSGQHNELSRLKSYKSGSKVIVLFGDIPDPMAVEREIIEQFKKRFEIACGREYFNGDIHDMRECFVKCVMLYTNKPEKVMEKVEQFSFEPITNDKNMFTCKQCSYTTEYKSNYTRHCKRKTGCSYQTANVDMIRSVNDESTSTGVVCDGYVNVNDDNVNERVNMSTSNIPLHKMTCKGVPMNNNINIRFGNENLEYIKQMRETDERVDQVIQCLSDVLDLVYFNADYPENQTVRKTNKKTDLIETRLNNDEWEQDESHVVIPKIIANLEKIANVEYADKMKPRNFKELLYHKTVRGPKSEKNILGKYEFPSF